MHKKWILCKQDSDMASMFVKELNVSIVIAQLLINRGIDNIDSARQFVSADLASLHDPFLLTDLQKAIDRIKQALRTKEKIMVFGDYDVDGVTSTALLCTSLKNLGSDLIAHIPHRADDGYGLNAEAVNAAKENGVTLVITVDCGINAFSEITSFNKEGIEVIVIDHHEPDGDNIPDAFAIIDPKRKDCKYPFKHLAAVGLVAKVVQALESKIDDHVLDLVSLGTIADVVPLIGENRIFVKNGLKNLNNTKILGLQALLDVANIRDKEIKPFHVGFVIGPRINAAGRMDSAMLSLELFMSNDFQKACQIAKELDVHNYDRQKLQKEIFSQAVDLVESQVGLSDQNVIVLCQEGWHRGLIGIVASKISEKYYRPTIIISLDEEMGVASARSVEGFHLYDALSECSHFLERFGGHKGAAGLTIKKDNIDAFTQLINDFAKNITSKEALLPSVTIDQELSFSELNLDLVYSIEEMEPFGECNPKPIFCSRNLTVQGTPQVFAKDTLKFWVTDGEETYSAVGFSMGKYKSLLTTGQKVDLAYQLSIDDWNKAPVVQLKIEDIKISR